MKLSKFEIFKYYKEGVPIEMLARWTKKTEKEIEASLKRAGLIK